jgi:pyruvate formate lyase activating enzyme
MIMKEASFYSVIDGKVKCNLCPHNCAIHDGNRGICRVRKNEGGKLFSESYGQICSMNFDPIEKKPLYHFFPGSIIFSAGGLGCNLHCKFCQNWEISQTGTEEFGSLRAVTPEELIGKALSRSNNIGIAYTYNEPTVWYEFMLETAKLAQKEGLKNVMVTNGFINPEPLEALFPFMDAFSVDLKAFTEEFYKTITASRLEPVLAALKMIRKSGRHLEITNLVITDTNDDEKEFTEMVDWIASELGKQTVLHISRYFPMFKMDKEATSHAKLKTLFGVAVEKLDYVYLGNLMSGEGQNTFCPGCKTEVIERIGYDTRITGMDGEGRCRKCRQQVIAKELLK